MSDGVEQWSFTVRVEIPEDGDISDLIFEIEQSGAAGDEAIITVTDIESEV